MNEIPKVTVVILNWNGVKFLKQNLNSVLRQTYKNYNVLVVDNGSNDESLKFLEDVKNENPKKLKILKLDNNLGYVGGYNKGFKKVLKEGASKYVITLNNDMKVDENWLGGLISGFDSSRVGICTSKILFYYPFQQIVLIPKENLTISSIKINNLTYHTFEFPKGFKEEGKLIDLPKKLLKGEIYNFGIPYVPKGNQEGKLTVEYDTGEIKIFSGEEKNIIRNGKPIDIKLHGKYVIQNAGSKFIKKRMVFEDRHIFLFDKDLRSEEVDAACGGSMAIRCDLLEKLGLFSDKYFMYFEDSELSFRFKEKGFSIKYVDKALCYHYMWGSTQGEVSDLQIRYGFRNRLWFIRKYFGIFKFLYYYLRVFGKFLMWGLNLPINKKAGKYFIGYLSVLKESLKPYE